ncbi:MAG: HD domain-containing phosphohydrolase [Solirubrobacterales bacterium]
MSVNYVGLPSTQRREAKDVRAEQVLMSRSMAVLFGSGIGFIFLWVALVGTPDTFTYMAAAICGFMAFVGLVLGSVSVPKRIFVLPLLVGTAVEVALSLHFQQSAAGFFLLMPAMYTSVFFWRDRPVAIAMTTIYTIAFVVTPLLIGGSEEISRVITTTPIFLALVLTTGFLGSESSQMSAKRGRFESTISSLLVALQERDGYTADHSEETVDLAMAVGDQLRITDEQRSVLADVALLHDIGKIGIPNEILNKRSGLDDHEWEFMKKHPEIGERIVSPVPGFAPVAKAIRHEHERWDGAGYPDGVSGEDIPLSSRVVLVCDAFHAMITDRPYRKSIGIEQARAEMVRHAGTQFDPAVVDALLAVIDEGGIPDSVGQAAWDGATNSVPQDDLQRAIAG